MSSILTISGNVKHTITIDPGVWIFDERKVDLKTYFSQEYLNHQEREEKNMAEAWNLHRSQGADALPKGNNVKVSRKDLTEKSFGVPFAPFLKNASPSSDAQTVIFERSEGEGFRCSLQEANEAIIGFSEEGKPLKENGPVHFYYGDGSNKDNPVTHINKIVIV
ncbi:peptidyl-prolyl cis-trans isomerase [Evansella sp. LMS18]|uniref:peptidyl-prolyl cis-trans isomerase n=1 Tax=Evansella sp. LMS18 TaxID=2924033 RepID=UPI0020D030FD|nr:peptidyl-prolyl cis-trans isomerase [Evansella sp. LMS18]UTR11010.1 peptidyl-prolyl cis-trans isomerase [Evansella sp. LMS18]